MDFYSLSHIATVVGAEVTGKTDYYIQSLLTDSRSASVSPSSLFFALKGERHNGHKYIADLYNRGVRGFVVSEKQDISLFPEAGFLLVTNTLQALQELAAHHRNKFNCPITAITGSNGKTIVKEWLFHCLSPLLNITRSPKSYNSQIGVPLSVWLLDENTEQGIIEAGISRTGEMERLEKIVRPTTGIFTNIGEAHNENFRNTDEKIAEKLRLFYHSHMLICCADHEQVMRMIMKTPGMERVSLFTWSLLGKGNVNIYDIRKEGNRTLFRAESDGRKLDLSIPFSDNASLENALHCLAYMFSTEVPEEAITRGLADLPVVAMRLEQKSAINNCTLINDSYNSDLNSLAIALDLLSHQPQHSRKTVILSDILQSGKKHAELYGKVASMVKSEGITRMIGIGPTISKNSGLFEIPADFYTGTDEFTGSFNPDDYHDEAILLKGSRLFEFERIAALFEQKKHTTRIEINLNALAHNLNYFRSLLNPGTRTMVMVKALSYGSGRHEIAAVLQFERVDYLGVAIADEGIGLRKAGINLPVMVMNPEPDSFDTMIRNRLEPEIYSFRMLELFREAVIRNQENNYPVHIKIDTGMHRLGFLPDETDRLCRTLKESGNLKVCSIFSHLAGSDEEHFDDFTRQQIQLFSEVSDKIIEEIGYRAIRHILNTSGIERFPDAQFDMVRLGIGLYGISSLGHHKLRNVSTLKSTILQIKPVLEGETVGYSRRGKLSKTSSIAIIPVGYADGLSRKAGNGTVPFLVRGKQAPIVGNICMDMTMIDVTGIEAEEGDDVVIFGECLPITAISEKLGTIPYEILTGVSERVKRVYFYE